MKKYLLIVTVAVVLFIVLITYPFQFKIDKSHVGIQYRHGDPEYSEKVKVEIKGVYKKYLFKNKNNTFDGLISINDNYSFESGTTSPLVISKQDNMSFIIYMQGVSMDPLGSIYIGQNFDQVLIFVFDQKGWNYKSGFFIVAPSENRNKDIETAKKLVPPYYLEHINWQTNRVGGDPLIE